MTTAKENLRNPKPTKRFTIMNPNKSSNWWKYNTGIQIEEIRQRHSNELGFLPEATFCKAIDRNRILIAYGEKPIKIEGFIFFGHTKKSGMKIYMICVSRPYQRIGIGTELIDRACREVTQESELEVTLRCREDLKANSFWEKIGFENTKDIDTENKRKKLIKVWKKNVVLDPL